MLFSNAFTSWQFLLLVWFWCSLSIFLGYPLWLVKLTEYFGTITQDLKLTVASYIWHVARCKWCLMLHFPVVIAASFSQTLPLCSGHQAQSCNLSWQEGMNDENNWLWAGMKVQLLKFKKEESTRDFQLMLIQNSHSHIKCICTLLAFKC